MAIVHLICGARGAGKTKYSMALAARARAVRFSMQEWMATLFGTDTPSAPDAAWASARMARCETLMWALAEPLLARGIEVVFDGMSTTREQRDRMRLRATQLGTRAKLHYMDVDPETRRGRLQRRYEEEHIATGPTSAVGGDLFEAVAGNFEPPSDDELCDAMIICESPSSGQPQVA